MTGLYRPCVGIALFDAQGRVFIGRRLREEGAERPSHEWQMPQGGIDPGEDPRTAVLRELYEETSVTSVAVLAEASDWLSYDLPADNTTRWKGKYIGQTQKWFALRFTGKDSEIDIARPGGGAHRPEFEEWRWENLATLPELIVPFKRAVYEDVVRQFAPFAAN